MKTYTLYTYKDIRNGPSVTEVRAQNIDNLRKNLIKLYSNRTVMTGICVNDAKTGERMGWLNVNMYDVNGNLNHVWTIGRSAENRLVNPKTGALL